MKRTLKQKVSSKIRTNKKEDIKQFVIGFYKRYGKAMSKLANE